MEPNEKIDDSGTTKIFRAVAELHNGDKAYHNGKASFI